MTERVEFGRGNKMLADTYREEYPEYLCSDDDARLTEVAFSSDVPDSVLDDARRDAEDARGETADKAGQVGLTDRETERLDFSEGRASIPHAQSVKGIARSEGVDDWLAYYDPTLTVDEHREVMLHAAREGRGGRRMDSDDSAAEKAGRASRTAQSEECDHARGHCRHGDPDACEFLADQCGFDGSEVQSLLTGFDEPDESGESDDLPGEALGALNRSWGGYIGAVDDLEAALSAAVEAWEDAQQAARAINGVRESHGQDPLHFEELEKQHAELADFARKAAADCHECHADHSGHAHDVTSGDREDLRELVDAGRGATPVGSGGDQGDDPTDAIEMDDQRTLGGDHADDQARLAGGEQGERGQGETVEHVEENPGGLMADERAETSTDSETEQQVPDAFNVAEGGQETF